MRRVTRIVLLAILGTGVSLLALGAVPSYLAAGEPYYLTVTPAADGPGINTSNLSQRRYPYLFDALSNSTNRSKSYRKGPYGFKESFSHSPFDELEALRGLASANATKDGAVYVVHDGVRYRVEVTQS